MYFIFHFLIIFSIVVGTEKDYFQQHVAYDIDVTLNDSLHTLTAFEKIVYTNNSPDTLTYIWFHLWPNAYKNTETAFAKQRERFYDSSFYYSEEKKRGYIDSLNFVVDGVQTTFDYHSEWIDVAKVKLPSPLIPGDNITIETPFFVKLPKVFSRLGHSGKHYEITQWYPKPAVYDHKGWHPMPYLDMGEFYSEFGSFDVKITLPENYRIMATGDLVDGEKEYAWLDSLAVEGDSLHALEEKEFEKKIKELKTGKKEKSFSEKIKGLFKKEKKRDKPKPVFKTLHFHQDKVHDFAWFADPKWIVRKGTLFLADSTREVTLWSMYLPKNAEQWENSIEYLHDSGYWYSKFCGDYPYNHITAVDGDMSAGGGMEYPNITVISEMSSKNTLEMVIMHEVGHNWFYGILGSNERDHTWMDEGLNEFSNIRYWEKKYGDQNMKYVINEFSQEKLGPFSVGKNMKFGFMEYTGYSSISRGPDEEPLSTSANDYKKQFNYWLSYSKPLVYSWHLLAYLGEETIDNIMHNYYEDWKFKHPYPEDFFPYFAKHSDKDLTWYTHDVFYKTGYVDYSVCLRRGYATFKNKGTLTLPFEVAFYNKKGDEISRQWFENVADELKHKVPEGTRSVTIDPARTLPDSNRPNNATKRPLSIRWMFDQPDHYKREVYWMPWVFQGNQYNGFTPGINAFYGYMPGYLFGYAIRPMWDFNNNQLIGSFSYKRDLGPCAGFYASKINFGAAKNAGRTGFRLELSGKRKEHLASYPVWEANALIDFHNVNEDAVDGDYYNSGELASFYTQLELSNSIGLFLDYYFKAGIKAGIHNAEFVRLHTQANIFYHLTEDIRTKLRIWVGGFVSSNNIPNQYRTYVSGTIDPDFRNNDIFNRTSDDNDINVGTHQYSVGGPSIHGLLLDPETGKMRGVEDFVASMNFDMNIPKLPGKPFIDFAYISADDVYYDFGWKFSFGPMQIIVPLYQSWDIDNPYPNDEQWIKDRMRFSLSISNISAGSLF